MLDMKATGILDCEVITRSINTYQGFIQDFWLGGEIYWCINEARKCERRGLGASPSLPPPPPPPPTQIFFVDLASLAKFDKFNAYAHQGCI